MGIFRNVSFKITDFFKNAFIYEMKFRLSNQKACTSVASNRWLISTLYTTQPTMH